MNQALTLLFIFTCFVSCSKKNETEISGEADTTAEEALGASEDTTLFSGTYEYSESNEDGYLYYKIKMHQSNNNITGTLSAGNYLASSENGFTNPNARMECTLGGFVQGNEAQVQMTVTKAEVLQEGAPDLYSVMNFPDLDTDETVTIWIFKNENGVMTCTNGTLMPDGETDAILTWNTIK